MSARTRVLILGGGYVGLYVALGLEKHRGRGRFDVTVVDRSPYMTYAPLLPEVAGGHVAPRDVTVPLSRTLRKTRVVRGVLDGLDISARTARVHRFDGATIDLEYDHVVIALGAVARVFPIPGLAENAIGFKTLEEAVHVRNQVLDSVAFAAATTDAAARRKHLTFVFVGGGYTGVEALSELNNVSRDAIRAHPDLDRSELNWILVEALDRVAPEVGPELSRWTLHELRRRGVDVRLKTQIESYVDGDVKLDSGETIPAETLVWTAGITPNPVLDATDVPRGPKGHVTANARLQVIRDDGSVVAGAWAAGDNAQVPDLTKKDQPAYYPPNAQNALRQAWRLAANIIASETGQPIQEYRHESLGTIASYGVGRGAALIKGVKLRGLPAWVAHRGYHGLAVPTLNRKVRVFGGWIVEALTRPEVTSLEAVERPRLPFQQAFGPTGDDGETGGSKDTATDEQEDAR